MCIRYRAQGCQQRLFNIFVVFCGGFTNISCTLKRVGAGGSENQKKLFKWPANCFLTLFWENFWSRRTQFPASPSDCIYLYHLQEREKQVLGERGLKLNVFVEPISDIKANLRSKISVTHSQNPKDWNQIKSTFTT